MEERKPFCDWPVTVSPSTVLPAGGLAGAALAAGAGAAGGWVCAWAWTAAALMAAASSTLTRFSNGPPKDRAELSKGARSLDDIDTDVRGGYAAAKLVLAALITAVIQIVNGGLAPGSRRHYGLPPPPKSKLLGSLTLGPRNLAYMAIRRATTARRWPGRAAGGRGGRRPGRGR